MLKKCICIQLSLVKERLLVVFTSSFLTMLQTKWYSGMWIQDRLGPAGWQLGNTVQGRL